MAHCLYLRGSFVDPLPPQDFDTLVQQRTESIQQLDQVCRPSHPSLFQARIALASFAVL